MPEGPEVWILSKAINMRAKKYNSFAHGKHLIYEKTLEDTLLNDVVYIDWSFGLTGKVHINNSIIEKVNSGVVHGSQCMSHNKNALLKKLGISWLHASEEQLQTVVNTWAGLNRMLGLLLLDQSQICGIGVAWGSEILWKAKLHPNDIACNQNLSVLVKALISVRDEIQKVYEAELNKTTDIDGFINNWFYNLYAIRYMNIYKKGTQMQVGGRTWWV